MKVAIASVQVPFIRGGAELLAETLCLELQQRGHQADVVTLPFKWYPPRVLRDCMEMGEKLDLSEVNGERVDRVIALKFPAYYLTHPAKVIWLVHQHRQAYDLWKTEFGDLHTFDGGEALRQTITERDRRALSEARGLYAISRNTADRLQTYNGLTAQVLYHPPADHGRFHCRAYEDFVFYPSRIDAMKRQELIVEAASHLRSGAKILLAGHGSRQAVDRLRHLIERHEIGDRVKLLGFISAAEKIDYYSRCLAVYFGAYDEDYGYVTLEALLSSKPVLLHPDAGGPLEFIEDGRNGHVIAPDPAALAERIDALASNPARAREMGQAGRESLRHHRIDWDHVIDTLLA